MKTIVLYNIDKEIVDKYKEIEELKDVIFKRIDDTYLDVTVQDIFEKEDSLGDCSVYKRSYMIMEGVDKDYLSILNKAFKDNDLKFSGVKAMKTEYNKNWKLRDLFDEITEEDEIMSRVTTLRKLIMSTNNLDLSKYEESLSFGLKQALMNGYILINSKDLNIIKLDESINNIKYFLNSIEEA
ncbi:MAG: DUF3783 domain-containing protein [Erysipelotrichaceae bacterium]|nr:DUF3783 domain-containing protein [Erysipelotrichaceae bacterium]